MNSFKIVLNRAWKYASIHLDTGISAGFYFLSTTSVVLVIYPVFEAIQPEQGTQETGGGCSLLAVFIIRRRRRGRVFVHAGRQELPGCLPPSLPSLPNYSPAGRVVIHAAPPFSSSTPSAIVITPRYHEPKGLRGCIGLAQSKGVEKTLEEENVLCLTLMSSYHYRLHTTRPGCLPFGFSYPSVGVFW